MARRAAHRLSSVSTRRPVVVGVARVNGGSVVVAHRRHDVVLREGEEGESEGKEISYLLSSSLRRLISK